MDKILFTSESVSEGHPDKVCDQIADAILDECLALDSMVHVAVECFVSTEFLLIGGEITFSKPVRLPDYELIAKRVIKGIGYDDASLGFSYQNLQILNLIKAQSVDIARKVNHGGDVGNIGAGDQGLMFGYASNETPSYMPLAITLAHELVKRASFLRKAGKFIHAKPDMKSQVTIDYTNPKQPRIDQMLMSIQHHEGQLNDAFMKFVHQEIMLFVAKQFEMNIDFEVLINPAGQFVIGGPLGDTGLTGRKIIVDTYGGYGRHGGGSFSGKDATKVDRSGAYMARYIAKNLVAAGVADRLEIQLSYAIGKSFPVSLSVFTFKTLKDGLTESFLKEVINKVFDLRPGIIIDSFRLNQPSFHYEHLAAYGHFGRLDLNLPWEKLDKVEQIKFLLIN
jgi:S-adenosylmethionine synthetase